jgi:hypothetical protein
MEKEKTSSIIHIINILHKAFALISVFFDANLIEEAVPKTEVLEQPHFHNREDCAIRPFMACFCHGYTGTGRNRRPGPA